MRTKRGIFAAVAIAAACAGAPAATADLDFSKLTCKQFISAPKDQIDTMLAWLEGYYTREPAPPIMYAGRTVKDAKNLTDYCNAHPDDNVFLAAESVMPAN
jgi:HdeA/HdeB family